ncbi:MAG: monovalent cation/H(+) antiporter subunit G [Arenicellales bacterium]|nr:monovalent cation/H(+) antiporter subunit G [Arenicellales bacterium]HCV20195.1 sodium:proton antiporter [Gammaproteobacteria bacterium]MDP6314233.1 monovalent cation/H(+) antiporter subunit G [Arenicellales bacterium]MDP7119725.1 monovalent cation/H(+) antiporter subunit G [Arenicellales bacterium]MDP7192785.1 monovalent cation/H(+) antiporter subunit G [Arenicellales bacterium]
MNSLLEVLSGALLLLGAVFTLVGGVGLLRMPDVFTRMHAAGITDAVAAAAIILGLALLAGWSLLLAKLLLVLALLLLLNPSACHALARAAIHGSRRPWLGGAAD